MAILHTNAADIRNAIVRRAVSEITFAKMLTQEMENTKEGECLKTFAVDAAKFVVALIDSKDLYDVSKNKVKDALKEANFLATWSNLGAAGKDADLVIDGMRRVSASNAKSLSLYNVGDVFRAFGELIERTGGYAYLKSQGISTQDEYKKRMGILPDEITFDINKKAGDLKIDDPKISYINKKEDLAIFSKIIKETWGVSGINLGDLYSRLKAYRGFHHVYVDGPCKEIKDKSDLYKTQAFLPNFRDRARDAKMMFFHEVKLYGQDLTLEEKLALVRAVNPEHHAKMSTDVLKAVAEGRKPLSDELKIVKTGIVTSWVKRRTPVGIMDRLFGLWKGADISGTTADTLFCIELFAELNAIKKADEDARKKKVERSMKSIAAFHREYATLLALAPLMTMTSHYHHTMLECALTLILNGYLAYYVPGDYQCICMESPPKEGPAKGSPSGGLSENATRKQIISTVEKRVNDTLKKEPLFKDKNTNPALLVFETGDISFDLIIEKKSVKDSVDKEYVPAFALEFDLSKPQERNIYTNIARIQEHTYNKIAQFVMRNITKKEPPPLTWEVVTSQIFNALGSAYSKGLIAVTLSGDTQKETFKKLMS